MTRDQLLDLAGGRVWTGRQAKANGLVDELGTAADAIEAARKMAGVPDGEKLEILELPESRSFLESLLDSRSDGDAETLARAVLRGAGIGRVAARCRCA